MEKKVLKFPNNFFWGVSTSAYQIEGNIVNDWSEWEKSEARIRALKQDGKKPEDYICGLACDSYNRYEEDIELVKKLTCRAYRFSIEWSRIEPEPGKYDNQAVDHYRQQIKKLRENNIEPFVTLWHFTNPLWVSILGGWENKETISYFLKYVEKIISELGDKVNFWLTLNEPETYSGLSYVAGVFPPQVKNLYRANQVFKNLTLAHKLAYQRLKNKVPQACVGLSHYANYHTAYGDRLINRALVKLLDYIRWQRFLYASDKYQDFIGLQYYHHDRVNFKLGGRFIVAECRNANDCVSDLGWEIYPEGIYHLLKYFFRFKKPIYITENGIADRQDVQRAKFINDHLYYVHKAVTEGVDVRGYFYWSLIDNFEWQHGWKPKFGLYAVDRKTFKRTARPSAKDYSVICQNNAITI